MLVYRICDCRYIDDLSGKGAAMYGGRWNNKDTYILYTAQSASLALLEAVVHLGKMPSKGYCMATIELPDDLEIGMPAEALPDNWATNPGPDALRKIGDEFIREMKHLVMRVPSVVMPEECNYLINPSHPLFRSVKMKQVKSMNIDQRIFKATA